MDFSGNRGASLGAENDRRRTERAAMLGAAAGLVVVGGAVIVLGTVELGIVVLVIGLAMGVYFGLR